MKVIAYLRVSGKAQVEGDGFARQAVSINTFCDAQNLECIEVFKDEGVSGTVEGMDRPAFSKAVEFALNSEMPVEAIVVERMDRLARDLMVQEFLLRECRDRGIKVFAADRGNLEDVSSNDVDPTRVLIRQILGALAQWEKANLVAKLAAARNRIKASGQRCEGNRPFGDLPGEKVLLLLVTSLRDGGLSWEGIADTLSREGYRTRRGAPWTRSGICDLYTKHGNKAAFKPEPESEEDGWSKRGC